MAWHAYDKTDIISIAIPVTTASFNEAKRTCCRITFEIKVNLRDGEASLCPSLQLVPSKVGRGEGRERIHAWDHGAWLVLWCIYSSRVTAVEHRQDCPVRVHLHHELCG